MSTSPPACHTRLAGRRTSRALLFLVVALAGLAGGPRVGAGGEVTDMLGRRVRVPDRAVRIVSLAPSITETVFVLGDGDRLAGVTDYCDYPPEATLKPRVGGISTPSFEAILALRPDLILATAESNYAEHVERLVSLGLAVYVVRPVDFETVLESIDRIGGVLGRDAVARARVASMRRDATPSRGRSRARPGRASFTWCGRTRSSHRAGARSSASSSSGPAATASRARSRSRTPDSRWRRSSSAVRTGSSSGATGRERSRSSSAAGSGSARSAPCGRVACSASTATSSTGRAPA